MRGWPRNRNEALVFLARPGGRLLEIGCGEGSILSKLAERYDDVLGIELSQVRATRAAEAVREITNCRIDNRAIEDLDEKEVGKFDCILWADVVEHVIDVLETMRKISSLVHENAQIVTVTPNVAYLPRRIRALLGQAPSTSSHFEHNEGFRADAADTEMIDGGHLHYFTFRKLRLLYKTHRIRVDRAIGFGRRLSRLRHVRPSLLSGAVCLAGTFESSD